MSIEKIIANEKQNSEVNSRHRLATARSMCKVLSFSQGQMFAVLDLLLYLVTDKIVPIYSVSANLIYQTAKDESGQKYRHANSFLYGTLSMWVIAGLKEYGPHIEKFIQAHNLYFQYFTF